jgi:hypothetical protein
MKAPEPTAYAVSIAANVAMEQHHKQVRKYTGEPYWNHCKASRRPSKSGAERRT